MYENLTSNINFYNYIIAKQKFLNTQTNFYPLNLVRHFQSSNSSEIKCPIFSFQLYLLSEGWGQSAQRSSAQSKCPLFSRYVCHFVQYSELSNPKSLLTGISRYSKSLKPGKFCRTEKPKRFCCQDLTTLCPL